MEFHPPPASDSTSSPSPAQLRPDGFWRKHPGIPDRQVAARFSSLTKEQLKAFDRDGFLLLKAEDVWTPAERKLIQQSVEQMMTWPDAPGKWMKYYEPDRRDPNAAKLLCRIENFTQFNPGLEFLLTGDKLPNMASDLFGERAIMYKEKVNFKLPGAAGFAPHQDVAAGWWMYGQSLHISCLVSIDAATEENGCLEVVAGHHTDGMLSAEWKELPGDVCEKFDWRKVPTKPGDVLFFDSYVPHKSAPNDTKDPRRVLYVTYAKESEGDFRERYYKDKRASFPPDCEREPGKVYEYKI